jgi:hypothetical protein
MARKWLDSPKIEIDFIPYSNQATCTESAEYLHVMALNESESAPNLQMQWICSESAPNLTDWH